MTIKKGKFHVDFFESIENVKKIPTKKFISVKNICSSFSENERREDF